MSAFGLDLKLAGEALWKVLVAGVVLGAGLPALFAVGIRGLAMGGHAPSGGDAAADDEGGSGSNALGNVLAAAMFVIVGYGVVAALLLVIASGQGKELTFDHVVPWIVPKQ